MQVISIPRCGGRIAASGMHCDCAASVYDFFSGGSCKEVLMLDMKRVSRLPDKINLGLGAVLFVSPWVLQYTDLSGATENAWLCGVIIMGVAGAGLMTFKPWEQWHSVVLGVWIVAAPLVLGFAAAMVPTAVHIVAGVVLVASAAWEIWQVRRSRGLTV